MITLRRSHERCHANHGWLDTYYSFSFSSYYDPAHMGFSSLRVINDDCVAPSGGFPTHGHRDMEIITYVLEGSLEHKDSMGNGSVIYPGDVLRMSAGTGITHSEYNPSRSDPLHLLQIWIVPDQVNVVPSYEQIHFTAEQKRNRLQLIASPDGRNGSVTIHQNAFVYASVLEPGHGITHGIALQRCVYVHVARGEVVLNGQVLNVGDGARIVDELTLELLTHNSAVASGIRPPWMAEVSKMQEHFFDLPHTTLEHPCSAEVLVFDLIDEEA